MNGARLERSRRCNQPMSERLKAALVEQAFHGTTQVSCRLPASGRRQPVEGAPAGDGPGMEALVPGGECAH